MIFLFAFRSCSHKCHKQWVWVHHRTLVFRVELSTNKEWMIWYFYYLYQVGIWVAARWYHTGSLELF